MMVIATTWGIGGPLFLWLYGGLCAVVAAAIWWARRRALGRRQRSIDPTPDLGLYKFALLNGGTQLAITTAATKLHGDGVLREGDEPHTHVVAGELAHDADRLERELVGTVRREPGLTTEQLRRELAGSEPIAWMISELTDAGLLVEERTARRLRRLWVWGALVALLGVARIVAGLQNDAPVEYLAIMAVAVAVATAWLSGARTNATARGQEVIRARREERADLRRAPAIGDSAMAVALFGGGALWLADPAIASSLDVPREGGLGWHRSSGGGCGGDGGTMFGGGCGSGGGGGCGGGGGGGGGGGCGGGG